MNDTIPGNLHVANDVLADMVGNAALTATDAGVHVALYVVIEYGTNINTVSQNLVDQVTFVLKEYARVPLDGVEVHVQGVKVRK